MKLRSCRNKLAEEFYGVDCKERFTSPIKYKAY